MYEGKEVMLDPVKHLSDCDLLRDADTDEVRGCTCGAWGTALSAAQPKESLPRRVDPMLLANTHLVGSTRGDHTVIARPPLEPIPDDEALALAAWIVIVAGRGECDRFDEIYRAILAS